MPPEPSSTTIDPATPDARLRAAQDPATMRAIFQRHLLQPAVGPALTIEECRLTAVRGRESARPTLEYRLRLAVPAAGRRWEQVVVGVMSEKERTRRAWSALPGTAPERPGRAGTGVLPPFAYVPDLGMLLQVFPHDYRLPSLAALTEEPPPEFLAPVLAAFGPRDWRLDGWTAEPVRYRPTVRGTLRLTVRAAAGATGLVAERRFYAKVFADVEAGRRGDHAQRELHAASVAGRAGFAVAEPILYSDDARTLIQSEVPGTPLQTILRQSADPLPAVRLAARTAAALHRLDLVAPPRPPEKGFPRPIREARDWLSANRPRLARELSALLDEVSAGRGTVPPTPTHGDLKPHHILIEGDHAAVIDFDDLSAGDPLQDVANMVAYLGQGRSEDRAEAAVRAFVDEYVAHVPTSWRARFGG